MTAGTASLAGFGAAGLAALALGIAMTPPAAVSRVRRAGPTDTRAGRALAAGAGSALGRGAGLAATARGRWLAAMSCGVGLLVLVGGVPGVVYGAVATVVAGLVLRRLEPRWVVRERNRIESDLPGAAHLLAGVVAAGTAPVPALELVADAIGGPVGSRLRRVATACRLGADPDAAWRDGLDGRTDAAMRRLATAMVRTAETGAPLAAALDRVADDLRAGRRAEAERLARTVGVRAAAPLGLCFLPAFLLVGVVPVVVGIGMQVLG